MPRPTKAVPRQKKPHPDHRYVVITNENAQPSPSDALPSPDEVLTGPKDPKSRKGPLAGATDPFVGATGLGV